MHELVPRMNIEVLDLETTTEQDEVEEAARRQFGEENHWKDKGQPYEEGLQRGSEGLRGAE